MSQEWKRWLVALAGAALIGWGIRWFVMHPGGSKGLEASAGCVPTSRAGMGAELPALELVVNSDVAPTEVTLQRSSSNTFTIRNVTSVPIDLSAISLFENVNNRDHLAATLPATCQYLAVRTNGCLRGDKPRTLVAGESCTLEVSVEKDALSGYLLFETSAGNLKAMISVL
jgi:hypothetical protein